jgi:hypothetical protein
VGQCDCRAGSGAHNSLRRITLSLASTLSIGIAVTPEVGEGRGTADAGQCAGRGKDPHFRCAFEEGEDR